MIKIIVENRVVHFSGHDDSGFGAHIEGKPGMTGSGQTIDEAVGDLIRSHSSEFNIFFDLQISARV